MLVSLFIGFGRIYQCYAFAIAAILCPTDAVAVSAITKGKILPKGSMSILEGESLLNDAAGIISFKIAVTALVTGSFSKHLMQLANLLFQLF